MEPSMPVGHQIFEITASHVRYQTQFIGRCAVCELPRAAGTG
jgi:hypothetical protein